MTAEMQKVLDIANALIADGLNVTVHFGEQLETAEINSASFPQYVLAPQNLSIGEESDFSTGYLSELKMIVYCIDSKASLAVQAAHDLLYKFYTAESGRLGAGDRPVTFQGVTFYKFKPGVIPMSARRFDKFWFTDIDCDIITE